MQEKSRLNKFWAYGPWPIRFREKQAAERRSPLTTGPPGTHLELCITSPSSFIYLFLLCCLWIWRLRLTVKTVLPTKFTGIFKSGRSTATAIRPFYATH
ncbi:hypothetical protein SLE2022_324450 [Rubroshorea leprosula]